MAVKKAVVVYYEVDVLPRHLCGATEGTAKPLNRNTGLRADISNADLPNT
jgi:hypothetical protein